MKQFNRALSATLLAVTLAATTSLPGAAQSVLGNRPFAKSLDGSLSARLSGPACAEAVDFVIMGKDAATFNNDQVATKFMNNIVATVRETCPRAQMFAAKGLVGDQIVYNAVAESATNWLLLELGASRDASLLGGGEKGSSADKANFTRRADFFGFVDLNGKLAGRNFLCSNWDNTTCTVVTELKGANSSGSAVIARSLLDSTGTQAVLSYAGTNRNGFLCSNPEEAKIQVVGGQASDMARNRMAADLRERLKPYGKEVCMGFAMRGQTLISANFDGTGARIGTEAVLNAMPAMAGLRKEK